MARAKDWAVHKLAELGFANVHAQPFTVDAWQRGAEAAHITAPFEQPLAVTAIGGSASTPPGGLTADVALFRTYEAFLAAPPEAVRDKIVVVTPHMTNES